MPVIRITDATWDRLKRWAVPLEDSSEDAVRKVLDAAEEHLKCPQGKAGQTASTSKESPQKGKRRLRRGQKTPQQAYHRPVLEALQELGGSGRVHDVLALVEKKVRGLLGSIDYEKLPSGSSVRWQNTAQWARLDLVKEGLLKSDSPPGVWELSERGLEQVKDTRT
ncbi:MAG: winged helix-turn-helix domain-containing protein [bacterium]